MKFTLFGTLLIIFYPLESLLTSDQKPFVTIFYDTNDASSKFFNEIVCLMDDNYFDKMHLELVPFGNARQQYNRVKKQYEFECDDGDCAAIREHACVLQRNAGRDVTFATFRQICDLFKDSKPTNLSKCEDNYLANCGTRTESIKPPITDFPAIAIDNLYDEERSQKVKGNFWGEFNSGSQNRENFPITGSGKQRMFKINKFVIFLTFFTTFCYSQKYL